MAKHQGNYSTVIKCPGCEQTGTVHWAEAEVRPRPSAGLRRTIVRVSAGFRMTKPVGAPTGFGRAKNGIVPGVTRVLCDRCETVQKT
jgi:hypothetical protein